MFPPPQGRPKTAAETSYRAKYRRRRDAPTETSRGAHYGCQRKSSVDGIAGFVGSGCTVTGPGE
jgi:hypothetical protein